MANQVKKYTTYRRLNPILKQIKRQVHDTLYYMSKMFLITSKLRLCCLSTRYGLQFNHINDWESPCNTCLRLVIDILHSCNKIKQTQNFRTVYHINIQYTLMMLYMYKCQKSETKGYTYTIKNMSYISEYNFRT